jgi:ADP-ribose pyrophosphatase
VEAVRHPGGAVAAAVDESGRVCLLRQYRPVVTAWVWELPAGKRDGTEDFSLTASRELREEAGLEADNWTPLGAVYTTPGFCDEVLHLFLARDLKAVGMNREEHEIMEVHWMPLDEAATKALAGEFDDAKTVIGLLRAAALLREEKG